MNAEELVLERNGFEDYNPVQRQAILKGVTEGKNIFVSSPTASGKTVIAELAMISSLLRGRKAVYTSPLRALASEHYREFKKKYGEFKSALSIGDYTRSDSRLKYYDAIFTTFEKLDSLMRHGAEWIKDVGVVVIDEVHVLDSDRGPSLELLIAKLKEYPVQFVALSATVPNADEVAGWLDAELVKSEWRPTKLREGVYVNGRIEFADGKVVNVKDAVELVTGPLAEGKGVLIFVPTRKKAMNLARELREHVKPFATKRTHLRKIAEEILSALESPTKQCKELSESVIHGVAFHHAGLVNKQREIVEEGFRKGYIKVVVATPTLAAGVNLPASRVIITSLKRSEGGYTYYIPVREYKQMAGRAGRPKYDREGESIVMAKDEDEFRKILEIYIKGEPEPVESRLDSYRAVRFYTLGLIVEKPVNDVEDIVYTFSRTFFFYQKGDVEVLRRYVEKAVEELEGWDMVEDLRPTPFGATVALSYIDPETGVLFRDYVRSNKIGELSFLFTVSSSIEMYPYLPVSSREELHLLSILEERESELPFLDDADPLILNKFKLSLALEDWINEKDEDSLLKEYGISPGQLYSLISNAEWLAHSVAEVARILGNKRIEAYARKMEQRIVYGVKEELLKLVQLRGIGRVRARLLFKNGYTTLSSIKSADPVDLARLLGPSLTLSVLEQLGVKVSKDIVSTVKTTSPSKQTTLEAFTDGTP